MCVLHSFGRLRGNDAVVAEQLPPHGVKLSRQDDELRSVSLGHLTDVVYKQQRLDYA